MHRASYTVDFKLSVVEWVKDGGRSLRAAAKQFGVDRKCIRQWVKERDVLGTARVLHGPQTRKLHGGRCPLSHELDRLVLGFILERRRLGKEVRDHELKCKAVQVSELLGLPDFKASPSWLKGWKHRNGLSDRDRLSEQDTDIVNLSQPKGSSVISHVAKVEAVLLPSLHQSPWEPISCHGDKASLLRSSEPEDAQDRVQSPQTSATRETQDSVKIAHVVTPDHTYTQPPSNTVHPPSPSPPSTSPHLPPPHSLHTPNTSTLYPQQHRDSGTPLMSRCYGDFLDAPLGGGHQLEMTQRHLSSSVPSYCSVQSTCVPSSDPVMSCTQVDHYCELDINLPLGREEVVLAGDVSNSDREMSLSSESSGSLSSSLATLSPPKRTSLDSRSKLWPALGCSRTSPVTFPEFHDFADPLTGLLANRLSQPVFPAGPEILCVEMFSSITTDTN